MANILSKFQTMPYTHRLATPADAKAIAPLMSAFAQERESIDPSMTIKPNYDFEQYVTHQLEKPLSFCWVLEHSNTIVGCLFIYFYDEAPPANLPDYLVQHHHVENPFQSRRVGSVLAMYVQPEHRQSEAIKLLANAAIQHAEQMKVTDIDLLIAEDQTGMQALLQRSGFKKAAVQFTRHYQISTNTELPSLHPPHPELPEVKLITPNAIALRDPSTNELVRNPHGEPVFLIPLQDENGLVLNSDRLPIYPTPVRDPQKNDWVFNAAGELLVCPVLRDESGQIVEREGIPQFCPPAYEVQAGAIRLKRDAQGNCVFCEVERDKEGKIVRSPDGMPVFKQPLLV
ncbi:MAG TPA: GNAT family N-acetyltransferase [Leptolyngbyaceae cyanobacterium]